MDEYISKTELLKVINSDIAEADNQRCVQLLNAILYAPTADVVPKSEVEEWVSKCRDWHEVAELKSKRIVELEAELSKTKAKIAREIIKDLVDFVDKKERQKLIFGKSIWYVESDDLTDFIAELKKKYIGG